MLRCLSRGAVAFGCIVSTAAVAAPPFEGQVLSVLNDARANPSAYAESLGRIRGFFRANYLEVPGRAARLMTSEGVRAVDDAIRFLARQRSVTPIRNGMLLAAAAADHVAEQDRSGAIGHGSSDGSGPSERVERRGGGETVAEVIEYGAIDAADVVRQLIVDDGVPERDHRAILFDPRLHFAGVSCGHHPIYRTMCVIDLAINSDGSQPAMEFAEATRGR